MRSTWDIAHHTVGCSRLFAHIQALLGSAASESGAPNLLGFSCTSHRAQHAVSFRNIHQMLKGISEKDSNESFQVKARSQRPQTLSLPFYYPAPVSRPPPSDSVQHPCGVQPSPMAVGEGPLSWQTRQGPHRGLSQLHAGIFVSIIIRI